MRKIITLRTFVLSALLIFAANLSAQDSATVPVYKDGDFWVFKVVEKFLTSSTQALDGDYEVTYKGRKFNVRRPGGERAETKQDLSHLRRMLDEQNDDHQLLQFPLSVGKKWTTDYEGDSRSSSQPIRRNAETKVTGIEQITTPAGAFRAFKIDRYETAGRGKRNTQKGTYTYYYSPEVGGIVKFAYERDGGGARNIELIKYAPAQ